MSLREQLKASLQMERQHNAHDDECAALAHLAHTQSRLAVHYAKQGDCSRAGEYRRNARWHLGKARQKRELADAVRARRLRVVA